MELPPAQSKWFGMDVREVMNDGYAEPQFDQLMRHPVILKFIRGK